MQYQQENQQEKKLRRRNRKEGGAARAPDQDIIHRGHTGGKGAAGFKPCDHRGRSQDPDNTRQGWA